MQSVTDHTASVKQEENVKIISTREHKRAFGNCQAKIEIMNQ